MNPSNSKQAKATATSPASAGTAPTATRVVSVDAYRVFVMLLMMAEVLEFGHVARAMPDSGFWAFLAHHQSHASWLGCSLHDLIQPSFSFLVSVALPFSLLRRTAEGQRFVRVSACRVGNEFTELLMPEHGVIFSDGIEQDFVEFNSGTKAVIGISERKGVLVQ
jgi:predicted acyltransferase